MGRDTPNPCSRTGRNPESPRKRYVEDAEYAAVYARVPPAVQCAMEMIYRTLQRPSDVLALTRTNLCERAIAGRTTQTLWLRHSKTGREIDIELSPQLQAVVDRLERAQTAQAHLPLIHNCAGEAYTLDGISAILRRHQKAARVASLGLQDLKAKGATDMYLAGVPLEQIRALCGHESVTTTEIYVKRHMKTIAQPNRLDVGGRY